MLQHDRRHQCTLPLRTSGTKLHYRLVVASPAETSAGALHTNDTRAAACAHVSNIVLWWPREIGSVESAATYNLCQDKLAAHFKIMEREKKKKSNAFAGLAHFQILG